MNHSSLILQSKKSMIFSSKKILPTCLHHFLLPHQLLHLAWLRFLQWKQHLNTKKNWNHKTRTEALNIEKLSKPHQCFQDFTIPFKCMILLSINSLLVQTRQAEKIYVKYHFRKHNYAVSSTLRAWLSDHCRYKNDYLAITNSTANKQVSILSSYLTKY